MIETWIYLKSEKTLTYFVLGRVLVGGMRATRILPEAALSCLESRPRLLAGWRLLYEGRILILCGASNYLTDG